MVCVSPVDTRMQARPFEFSPHNGSGLY
eukprot:COSAG06_NODE_5813_length_3260_cov_19.840240_5_plen_27_part_01